MYIGNFHMHKLESKSDFAKMKKKHEKNMPKNFNDYDGFVFYEKDNYHVVFRKMQYNKKQQLPKQNKKHNHKPKSKKQSKKF